MRPSPSCTYSSGLPTEQGYLFLLCFCAHAAVTALCIRLLQVVLTVGTIVFGLYVATRILKIEPGGGGGGSSKGRGKGRRRGRFVRQSHPTLAHPPRSRWPTPPIQSWLTPPVHAVI